MAEQLPMFPEPDVPLAPDDGTLRRALAGYIASIDWYCGNDLLHFIALANGQFALLPSHKIMFGDGDEPLPDYEKLRAEWRV